MVYDLESFTLKQSPPDDRDYVYVFKDNKIKDVVDLRAWDSLVESQGNLGSCVGNAVTNAYELQVKRRFPTAFVDLSRLFVYYNARWFEGTIDTDEGVMYIRSALKGVSRFGVCTEKLWPYQVSRFNMRPPIDCYVDAELRKIGNYTHIANLKEMLEVIDSGMPVVAGMVIYNSFMYLSNKDSIVKMPTSIDYEVGGHAMCILGYDLNRKVVLAKNSFGTEWGASGYCEIPFDYVDNYVFEMWNFDIVSQSSTLLLTYAG